MRKFVLFAVTLVLISAGGLLAGQGMQPAPATPPPGAQQSLTGEEKAVLGVLRQLEHAQFTRDVATFSRLTVNEFVHLDPDGSLTNKEEWLRVLEDEPQRLTTPPEPLDAPLALAPGMVLRIVGPTAIVVKAPRAAAKGDSARVVTVLVKREAGWQQLLINRQVVEDAASRE